MRRPSIALLAVLAASVAAGGGHAVAFADDPATPPADPYAAQGTPEELASEFGPETIPGDDVVTASSEDATDAAASAPTAAPPVRNELPGAVPVRVRATEAGAVRARLVLVPSAPAKPTVVASLRRRTARAGLVTASLAPTPAARALADAGGAGTWRLELHTAFDPVGPGPVHRTAKVIGQATP